jgi:hypothetical protein
MFHESRQPEIYLVKSAFFRFWASYPQKGASGFCRIGGGRRKKILCFAKAAVIDLKKTACYNRITGKYRTGN